MIRSRRGIAREIQVLIAAEPEDISETNLIKIFRQHYLFTSEYSDLYAYECHQAIQSLRQIRKHRRAGQTRLFPSPQIPDQ